jgi:HK97 gp10 family phage protein
MPDLADAIAHFGRIGLLLEASHAKMLKEAAETLRDSAKDAIGTHKFGWEPLAEATLARKQADTPLLDSGELRDSIECNSDERVAYVGSDNPKAEWHEFGTPKIPARPFLGGAIIECEERITDMLGKHVKMIIER